MQNKSLIYGLVISAFTKGQKDHQTEARYASSCPDYFSGCIRSSLFAAALLFACTARADTPPPLYSDKAVYPPFQLTWSPCTEIKQLNAIFPHPVMTQRIVVTVKKGLFLSDDSGRTWKPLPEANADKVGVIQKVEFHPTQVDTFYLASQTKGIWVTTDGGKTFQQAGNKASGMASDTTEDVILYPVDTFHKTLLAVHGTAAPGISRSRDGGKTWDVLNTGYTFRRLLTRERESKELYLFGSTKEEPDVQNLYVCNILGEPVVEVMHDSLFTDMAFGLGRKSVLYVTTSDSGLYRIDTAPFTPDIKQLGSKNDSWASLATIWGSTPDVVNLCLFNPKLGLIFTSDDLATNHAYGGLPIGSIVKEGACIRPNANGTIFYAAINEELQIGRPNETVPIVNITPASFEPVKDSNKKIDELRNAFQEFSRPTNSIGKAAINLCQKLGDPGAIFRQNQITITARIPVKPTPVSVTADLSRMGGSPTTPLYDDGQHNDGAAGDGVYGTSFFYQPMVYNIREDDKRPIWPGRVAIGVSATYPDGSHQGAVGVAGIYPKVQSVVLSGYWSGWMSFSVEGDVKAEPVPNLKELHENQPTTALAIHPGHGPWAIHLNTAPWSGGDITGYEAFSFGIRSKDGTPPKELYMQLRDTPDLAEEITTDRVPIIHDCVPDGIISSDYRKVVVPFNKLLGKQSSLFQTSKLSMLIISGDGGDPVTLLIDWPCYLPPSEEKNPADKAPSK